VGQLPRALADSAAAAVRSGTQLEALIQSPAESVSGIADAQFLALLSEAASAAL
jgi:hypothetical protein